MKSTHAANDLERQPQDVGILKRLFRRKAKKVAPAEANLKAWAASASGDRNKS